MGVRLRAAARDPFFQDSFFGGMAQFDREMDALSRQLDAEIGRTMEAARRMEASARADADRALAQAQQGVIISEPGIQVRRSEERGVNSYRYYESISISSGPTRYHYGPQLTAGGLGPSPWLFAVAMMAGAYAALAAAFTRNLRLTTYNSKTGWQLGLLWPFLVVTSKGFREQFFAAVRGQRPAAADPHNAEQKGGSAQQR